MAVLLTIQNKTLKSLLEEGLVRVDLAFEANDKIDLIVTDDPNSLKNGDEAHFLIGEGDKMNLNGADKLFSLPVRVGNLCDEIAFFISQKKLRQSLKPISLGKFTLYPETLALIDQKSENQIKITDKELSILLYLSQNHPKKTSREDLLHQVWQYAQGVETHTLETHIYRLRQKIEDTPSTPEFLITDDEGYYLNL